MRPVAPDSTNTPNSAWRTQLAGVALVRVAVTVIDDPPTCQSRPPHFLTRPDIPSSKNGAPRFVRLGQLPRAAQGAPTLLTPTASPTLANPDCAVSLVLDALNFGARRRMVEFSGARRRMIEISPR